MAPLAAIRAADIRRHGDRADTVMVHQNVPGSTERALRIITIN
jgi:hypothetical protein